MKRKLYLKVFSAAIGIIAIIGLVFIMNESDNVSAKIKVGVAETIVTPPNPVGQQMSGYDRGKNTSTGIHDDLFARSIVVEAEDGTSVAMITIAIVNMSEQIMDSIRSGVNRGTGIPFKNVLVSATHTHSGPTLGSINESYAKFFIQKSVESAVKAEPICRG